MLFGEGSGKMKKIWIPITFILIGIMCMISYAIIGAHIDSQGILVEPFFLIPTGYFFLTLGILLFILIMIFKRKTSLKKQ